MPIIVPGCFWSLASDIGNCKNKADTHRMSAFNLFWAEAYIFIEDERSVPFLVFIV